jgi:hypothetical protein
MGKKGRRKAAGAKPATAAELWTTVPVAVAEATAAKEENKDNNKGESEVIAQGKTVAVEEKVENVEGKGE